jgi:hypothetical protein
MLIGIAAATIAGVVIIATAIGVAQLSAGSGNGPTPRPSQSVCERGGSRCVGVGPIPVLYRNLSLGYNLVIPTEFTMVDESGGQSPPNSPARLVSRLRLTARPSRADAATTAQYGQVPPWDLVVEVYTTRISALALAQSHGCATGCATTPTTLGQQPALLATWSDGQLEIHGYYVERPDRILVFRYATGETAERPSGVTEEILQRIIEQVGLL